MITKHNIWNDCLYKLSQTLTEKEMRLWIAPLKVKKDGDALKLYAPNKFMKEEIEKNFLSKISDVVNQLTDNTLISLDVSSPVITNKVTRTMPSGYLSNLNSDMTFDSFVEGKSNQLAKAACLSVVNEPGAFNPLYIYGGVGLGKTHLLHSIGNQLSSENKKVVYLHSEKFVQNMVTALRNNQIEEFKKFYRNLDVLLLDDIQFFAGKERSQEEFFHTFNSLFEYKKQVVLTCDKYPKEINGLEDRIKSRLVWGLNVSIDPPDLETRVAILQSKAENLGMPINNEVAFFLARNINSNVRELEGNLRRVLATARFRKCDITLDFTKDTCAIIGTAHKGPAFVPKSFIEMGTVIPETADGNINTFARYFGDPTGSFNITSNARLAADRWLSQANEKQVSFIRVLGAGNGKETNSRGVVEKAGFVVGTEPGASKVDG